HETVHFALDDVDHQVGERGEVPGAEQRLHHATLAQPGRPFVRQEAVADNGSHHLPHLAALANTAPLVLEPLLEVSTGRHEEGGARSEPEAYDLAGMLPGDARQEPRPVAEDVDGPSDQRVAAHYLRLFQSGAGRIRLDSNSILDHTPISFSSRTATFSSVA